MPSQVLGHLPGSPFELCVVLNQGNKRKVKTRQAPRELPGAEYRSRLAGPVLETGALGGLFAGSAARLRFGLEAGRPAGWRDRAAPSRARFVGNRTGGGLAHDPLPLDDPPDFIDRQRLVFEQPLCQCVQLVHTGAQNFSRGLLAFVDDAADLLVDHLGGRLGNVLALRNRVTEKYFLLVFGVAQGSELLAEPNLGHPAACETG